MGPPGSRRLFGRGVPCAARLARLVEWDLEFIRYEDADLEEARRALEEPGEEDGDSARPSSEAGQSKD